MQNSLHLKFSLLTEKLEKVVLSTLERSPAEGDLNNQIQFKSVNEYDLAQDHSAKCKLCTMSKSALCSNPNRSAIQSQLYKFLFLLLFYFFFT